MDRKGSYSAGGTERKGCAMEMLIWLGAALALVGIAGLVQCARLALRAKGQSDDEARATMAQVVTLNIASMGLSILGLMLVVAGLFLR